MFTVFDLETTGFSGASDDVVQFSYLRFDDKNMVYDAGCLYFYYEGMSWSEDAENVHHISQEFLKQYEDDFDKNCIKMWTILSGANVVGHNAKGFDCPFAKTWLGRMGLSDLTFGIINDTMLAFRPMTHTSKVKLTKLSAMNSLTPEVIRRSANVWFNESGELNAHNATYDTAATALLTLIALNKGYMSFEAVDTTSHADVDVALLDDLPVANVDFTLIEADGSERVHTLGGHKEGSTIEFPIKLTYVSHNHYEQWPYAVFIGSSNDRLVVNMLGTELTSGVDFDLIDYTKKLSGGSK